MDRELDDLLARLRQSPPPGLLLQHFDRVLRDRIGTPASGPPRLRLSFQLTAVVAAFVIGLVVGINRLPGGTVEPQVLLADVMDP